MATNDWDDDDFDDNDDVQTQAPATDSELVKRLRKQLRQREKEHKELAEKYESVSKAERERTVKEVLNQKGVNPKAARLILKDLETVNEESVSHWLDDNGDLFGFEKQVEQDPQQQIDRAALRQQDIVSQGAISPDRNGDIMTRINNASEGELIEMIQSGNF